MKKVFAVLFTILAVVGIAQLNRDTRRNEFKSIPCECKLPYDSYVAKVSQTNIDDPIANVLYNNTGGTLTWVRDAEGGYRAITSFTFDPDKLFIYVGREAEEYCMEVFVNGNVTSTNEIFIQTLCEGIDTDSELRNTSIEFRFY